MLFRTTRVRKRLLMLRQKRPLSSDAAVRLKQLLLRLTKRERRHQRAAERVEAERERLIPTPLQSQSRCQNSRTMKEQRDRSICRGMERKSGGLNPYTSILSLRRNLTTYCIRQLLSLQEAICEQTENKSEQREG